jgi:DNA topoisomerase I
MSLHGARPYLRRRQRPRDRKAAVPEELSLYRPQGASGEWRERAARIAGLGVPPAYEDVWICVLHNGHVQATGLDAARRKQYRYHPEWTANQDQANFEGLADFGRGLPCIRRAVEMRLAHKARAAVFDREVACATLVRLIDNTAIRIGGRSKASQGATTLQNKHVSLERGRMKFHFTAKGGRRVRATIDDRQLQRVLGKIHDLPGKRLFQYIGPEGLLHPLGSGDVNNWLKDIGRMPGVSAKVTSTRQHMNLSVILPNWRNFNVCRSSARQN